MTVSKSHAYFTPEDYLELERISPIKHEQGQMVAMAGASKAHVIIDWQSLGPTCQPPARHRLHFLCNRYESSAAQLKSLLVS